MERFTFNLQKVLDFRVDIEEKRKEEYVSAQKHFLTCESILEDFIQMRNNALMGTNKLKSGSDFQSFSKYIDFINKRIEAARENLKKAEVDLTFKKEELLSSSMDRKVIEKLKEKAKSEYDLELLRIEQKQNDDFAIHSFLRNERR